PTVLGGLAAAGVRVASSGPAERQGVVHRLDAGTTGVMVVAASEHAYTVLKRAFKERTVDKWYHALVQGLPDPTRGTIDAPIDRHPRYDYRFAVVAGGKPSVTHYEVIEAFRSASLAEVNLETGRTHQIRVHFAGLRHPCVGDLTYGADPALPEEVGWRRQWLHARRIGFAHPDDGSRVEFISEYPDDLASALDTLRARTCTAVHALEWCARRDPEIMAPRHCAVHATPRRAIHATVRRPGSLSNVTCRGTGQSAMVQLQVRLSGSGRGLRRAAVRRVSLDST